MSEQQPQENLLEIENKIRIKYSRLSKLVLILGLIFILWAAIVFSGVIFWGYSYDWAVFDLDFWLLVVSIILVVLIVLVLALYLRFSSVKTKQQFIKQPEPEFIDGKRIHVFTHPEDVEGGIFSKTLIEIDAHNVLRLRSLMISPGELWFKKSEEKKEEA